MKVYDWKNEAQNRDRPKKVAEKARILYSLYRFIRRQDQFLSCRVYQTIQEQSYHWHTTLSSKWPGFDPNLPGF
jgi:hypothetical protein